jgi:hypothetical protein
MFSNQYLYSQARARAIAQQQAEQRARRVRYLPHEEEDSSDGEYVYPWLSPRDRLHLQARQDERRRREQEALRKQMQARREEQVKHERERVSFSSYFHQVA